MSNTSTSYVGDESKSEIVPSSPAKKQRCGDPTILPSSALETDPRSIIKFYKYDSDEEYEDVDISGMHEMTDREFDEYSRQIRESDGFDVMHFPKSFGYGKIMPILDLHKYADKLKTLSELALRQEKNSKLEFLKIVKANSSVCAGFKYYLTFDVKDASASDDRILTYQALVWDGISKTEVLLCRPKNQ